MCVGAAILAARCINENEHYAALTDIIYKTWAGKSAREYRQFKGLKKDSLRDNMTNTELVLNMPAETSTTDISKQKNPQSFEKNADAPKRRAVAKAALHQLEKQLWHDVISPLSASKAIKKQLENKDGNDCPSFSLFVDVSFRMKTAA